MEDAKAKISSQFYHHHDNEECLCLPPDLKEMVPLEIYKTFELVGKTHCALIREANSVEEAKVQDEVPWMELRKDLPSDNSFKDSIALTLIGLDDPWSTIDERAALMERDFSYDDNIDFNTDACSSAQQKKKETIPVPLGPSDLIVAE